MGPPLFSYFGELLVDRAGLRPRERVLDVAEAERFFSRLPGVGDDGRVIGVDIAPGMVERVRAAIPPRGITNAEAQGEESARKG